jgi:hypothetical protein
MGTERGGGESLRPAGVREIEVSDLELRDGVGRTSSVFHSGGTLELMVMLRARRRIERAALVLELHAQDGTRVFRNLHELDLGPELTAQLSFAVADLALLGGDYDVLLGAAELGREPSLDRTARFSVASPPGAEGIVDLRGSWHTLHPVERIS